MKKTPAASQPLPFGTVDRERRHFVLLHGEQNTDSKSWVELACIGGSDPEPVVELARGLTPRLRALAEAELDLVLHDDGSRSTFAGYMDESGEHHRSWTVSLDLRVGSTSNWYGDLHWARRRSQGPEQK
jgi:hypothetical protein